MTFSFVGKHWKIGRIITGFHSLDHALKGNDETLGWPTRTLTEIFGGTGVGKTTFSIHILSLLSQGMENCPIACLDLENQDEAMVTNVLQNSGYSSENFLWIEPPTVNGNIVDTDEALLGQLIDALYQEPSCLGLLDSVASISPVAEVQGSIGDANMGRRAFPMAQFSRRVVRALRSRSTAVIMTNHSYPKMQTIGGAIVETQPGGEVKNNESLLRIQMRVPWVDYLSAGAGKKEARWDGSWVMEGKIVKNRVGAKDKRFQVFVYGGWGLHKGMSAIMDCLSFGMAEVAGGKVKMDGTDYGLLSRIIERERDNDEFFSPFQNTLKSLEKPDSVSDDEKPKRKKKK